MDRTATHQIRQPRVPTCLKHLQEWGILSFSGQNHCMTPTGKRKDRNQDNTLHNLPQLLSEELWRIIRDPVFHIGKAIHNLYKNTGLEPDAFKTKFPNFTVAEGNSGWLSSKGILNTHHNSKFLTVPSSQCLFWGHVVSRELLALLNSSFQCPSVMFKSSSKRVVT